MKKISITLPDNVLADLSMIANTMGISRSAFIAELITEPIGEMMTVVKMIPKAPDNDEYLRFRGESEVLIKSKITELNKAVEDLYHGKG